MTHEAGKGSAQRPFDKEKFEDNWDRIFGKKELPRDEEAPPKENEESS